MSSAALVETRWDEAGFTEWLNEDRPTVVRELSGGNAVLLDLETRKVIGYRVYDTPAEAGEPVPVAWRIKGVNITDDPGRAADWRKLFRRPDDLPIEPLYLAAPGFNEGLEAAIKAIEAQKRIFQSEEYATPQPMGSLMESFACDQCAAAIRALRNPNGETDRG